MADEIIKEQAITSGAKVPKAIRFIKKMGGASGTEPFVRVEADFRPDGPVNVENIDARKVAAGVESKFYVTEFCGRFSPGTKDHEAVLYIVKGTPNKALVEIKAPDLTAPIFVEAELPF